MAKQAFNELPAYLKKYIVEQDQTNYTPVDQAVWRYILTQLKAYLQVHAHESYLEGLEQTGISTEEIPSIDQISQRLSHFGWKALPVSGFIPPAAFMELQSLGILPIASDMRTLDHLLYTPAPDIVHEAAGHAPLLVNKEYSNYLKQYAQIAKKALISKEDLDVYKAIRDLSDIKENPHSTPSEVQAAEQRLLAANHAITHTSEAALLSRMNWWTAEYGLIGDLTAPKIIGAGLLSSVGESELYLSSKVKKIPLSLDCIQFSYDITEPQPQLFVARDFAHLMSVLEQMSHSMAYQTGGPAAVAKAIQAQTVNTVELDTGLQIGGICKSQIVDAAGEIAYLNFEGPTQLAYSNKQLDGQGIEQHSHGFGTPVGLPIGLAQNQLSFAALQSFMSGDRVHLRYHSGVEVTGQYLTHLEKNGVLVVLSLKNAKAILNDSVLFDPEWGTYDMAIGSKVSSVYAGPPDHSAYGETEDFAVQKVPRKISSKLEQVRFDHYQTVRSLRTKILNSTTGQLNQADKIKIVDTLAQLQSLAQEHARHFPQDWLLFLEIFEIGYALSKMTDLDAASLMVQNLSRTLKNFSTDAKITKLIQDGLREIYKNTLFQSFKSFTVQTQQS